MQQSWKLKEVHGKISTDKNSGCILVFEGQLQMDLFDQLEDAGLTLKSAQFDEQFGKLTLKSGSRLMFDDAVKLKRTDKRGKTDDELGASTFRITPTLRLSPKQFGDLFGTIDTHFEIEFTETASPDASAGDGRPHADVPGDDNVIPDSPAAHMKAAARKRARDKSTA